MVANCTSIPSLRSFEPSKKQRHDSKLIHLARSDCGTLQVDTSVCQVLEKIATGETSILALRINHITGTDHWLNKVTNNRQLNAAYLQRYIGELYQLGRKLEDGNSTLSECAKLLLGDLKLRTGHDIQCNLKITSIDGKDRIELGSILKCTVELCNSEFYDHRLIGKYLQSECFKDDGERVFSLLDKDIGIYIDWSNKFTTPAVTDYLVSLVTGKRHTNATDMLYAQRKWDIKAANPAWKRVLSLITHDPVSERDRAAKLLQSAALRKLPDVGYSTQVKWLGKMLGYLVKSTDFPFDSRLYDPVEYRYRRELMRRQLIAAVLDNTRLCKNLSSLIVDYLYND